MVSYLIVITHYSNDSDYFYEDLEEDAEPMKMPSPEHLSFVDLEKKMTVCETDKFPSGAIKILVMEEGGFCIPLKSF